MKLGWLQISFFFLIWVGFIGKMHIKLLLSSYICIDKLYISKLLSSWLLNYNIYILLLIFLVVTVHEWLLKMTETSTLWSKRPCTCLCSCFLCGLSGGLLSLCERPVLPEIMHCDRPRDKTEMHEYDTQHDIYKDLNSVWI